MSLFDFGNSGANRLFGTTPHDPDALRPMTEEQFRAYALRAGMQPAQPTTESLQRMMNMVRPSLPTMSLAEWDWHRAQFGARRGE